MARNNVQTTVHVGMDVQLAKRNAEALKEVIATLKRELKETKTILDNPGTYGTAEIDRATEAVKRLTLQIQTLQKVQRSATPAAAYESYLSGDVMNSNKLRQGIRGGKNRLNSVPYAEGADKEARRLLSDVDKMQMQLNRLQAGFTKPLRSVKKELNDLSNNELQRLLQLLKQEQQLVTGNERAWANYAVAIDKVEQRMREYDTVARQQVGASTLSKAQSGGFATANERDIQRAIDKLKEYRAVINDPRGSGMLTFEATNAEIGKLQARLDTLKQKALEASGQAMDLGTAYAKGMSALNGTFKGTTQQLDLAKKTLQEALRLEERGTGRYNDLKDAIRGIEMEEKRMGMTAKEVQAVLDSPKGKSFNELKIAVEQGRMSLANMRTDTDKGKKAFDELAKKVKEAEFQMKELGNASKGTASAWDKAWSRLKTYIGLYMGAAVAIQKLTATLGDLMELSDKMGEVRKTTGFTADEVGRLSESLKKMDTRTSINGLLDLSVAAGQLGLKTEEDVLGFTEAANKLMVALPEMGKEGATEMLKVALATGEIDKIRKQMEQGLIDGSSATAVAMEKVGSTIDRLRATSAATAPAITDFVKRVGAVGAQSGISIDQVAALGSTVDALGMRVEMSATALSRMMPAIKNNAFDIAKILGVTPNTIRELYDTGQGMEVILMILQRMKDSNMDADSIEQMLGMGGMKEIMKELNQQGARAGIVFGGLSQNVDELRRQLGVAKQAYEENIAIQNEYNKMNETTAAKWERLKNQLEEAFVGDRAQRFLGDIIDGLRWIVDFLTGNVGPALRFVSGLVHVLIAYWAALKLEIGAAFLSAGGAFKNFGIAIGAAINSFGLFTRATANARAEWKKLDAAMKANIWGAVITALSVIAIKLWDMHKASQEAAAEVGRFNEKLSQEKQALDSLFNPLMKGNIAQKERSRLITEINSKYGRYLGFMLSETNSAIQLANAHALIAKRIREEAYEKRILDQENKVREKYEKDINAAYGGIESAVRGGAKGGADITSITDMLKNLVDKNIDKIVQSGQSLPKGLVDQINGMTERLVNDGKLTRKGANEARTALYNYLDEAKSQAVDMAKATANTRADLRNVRRDIQGDVNANLNSLVNSIKGFGQQQRGTPGAGILARPAKQGLPKPQWGATQFNWQGNANVQADVQLPLPGELPKVNRKNIESVKQFVKAQDDLRGYLEANAGRISQQARATAQAYLVSEKELEELRRLIPQGDVLRGEPRGTGGAGGSNIWGQSLGADSTDWKNMTAEQLVARRDQMNKFVNALQTDTDVKAVLEEDAALKKAIENGMSSDMRTVIEWYNTERLKIQDELHARHLTNTGAWMDPKKQKAARKQFRDEISTYLHELDAYYTERKTRIEEAGTDEGLTEAEIKNRTLANEMEWHQRRAELQKLYARKSSEVTQEEQDAIYHIISERTGDSEKFVKQMIGKTNQFVNAIEKSGEKGAAMVHNWLSKLSLDVERDYLKQQQALTKQMRAIEAIIDKERPFNGITRNLRENLVTMDILTGDMREEYNDLMKKEADMTKFNERQAAEELKRTTFMLGEAENAYSTTIEKLMEKMRQQGFTSWADWLQVQPKQQEAIMAQLRSTYDDIQDAIKKEASQLKKQAEIMWNNILLPGGDGKTTLKQMLDRTVAQLGIDEGRVSRANSLIGAGQASERVADRLAIKQMQLQLNMQEHYYALMKKQGQARVDMLNQQADAAERRGEAEEATRKRLDSQHAAMSLNLATSKEETELAKQREEIIARTEESQNRLYKSLREWADLLGSSVQSMFEASHAGDKEYYNERAKMALTGKGGPGAGTYVIIDNAGTEDAEAHYEYLNEREALERQREIERQNAQAEAWRKVMDDINMKMSDMITDQINAMLQNASIGANTDATNANTRAINTLTEAVGNGLNVNVNSAGGGGESLPVVDDNDPSTWGRARRKREGLPVDENPHDFTQGGDMATVEPLPTENMGLVDAYLQEDLIEKSNAATQLMIENSNKLANTQTENDKKAAMSSQSMFAKMTQAANLYGIAYQAMSNDNLSTTQKFEMIALQAVGNAAIAALTTNLAQTQGEVATQLPGILGKAASQLGPIAGPIAFAAMSALLGGLMGMAVSKIAKSKSEIAQATGSSVGAGRLATGMLTYAEGNVNEFTDPSTLQEGRQYNVDAADGRTYRARYMGRNPKTHLTNGPEFHLSGERGREMIIDAGTTRQITTNDNEIWHAIQTLSGGGSLRTRRRQRAQRGVSAFADGRWRAAMI